MSLSSTSLTIFAAIQNDPANPGSHIVTYQSNRPQLEELDTPSGSWGWSVDNVTGFSGGPNFYFDVPSSGPATLAELVFQYIQTPDFLSNTTGQIEISLSDNGPSPLPPRQYIVDIHLRYIGSKDFTVFEGQSSAGVNPPSAPPPGGGDFSWGAEDVPGLISALSFDLLGRIDITYLGTWDTEASFTLVVGNSRFFGATIRFRQLVGDGYTYFENQTSCAPAVNPVDTSSPGDNYTFTATFGDTYPGGCTFDQYGGISTIFGTIAFDGTSDTSFDLEIIDNHDGISRPSAIFDGAEQRNLRFRRLIGNTHVFMENQISGSPGISPIDTTPGGDSYTLTPEFDPAYPCSCTFDNYGTLAPPAGPIQFDGASDTNFDLEIIDNSSGVARPASRFSGAQQRQLVFRRLAHVGSTTAFTQPSPIRLGHSTKQADLEVTNGTGETWHFEMSDNGLDNTVCHITEDPGSAQTTIYSNPADTFEPGEYGTAQLTVQLMNGGIPEAPACQIDVPISVDMGLEMDGGGTNLPLGREKMRYIAPLLVDSSLEPGHSIALDFVSPPAFVSEMEIAPKDTGGPLDWLLQTLVEPSGDLHYLPDTASGTHTLNIVAQKHDGSSNLVAQSEPIPFNLEITNTKDTVNTTILLDRSGSMNSEHRWDAASSGAGSFASLVSLSPDAANCKLGAYWFNSGTTPAGTVGTYDLGSGDAKTDGIVVGDTCIALTPGGSTALGKGLLHCRDAFPGADTKASAERVILALTDGMENQTPLTPEIFDGSTTGTNSWLNTTEGDPAVRIYPLALMSIGSTWIDRLEHVVTQTGGIPELDLSAITSWTTGGKGTTIQIGNWFMKMFASLYGYTTVLSPPDPELRKGHSATETVQVHSGQSQVVFYLNHDGPNAAAWQLEVTMPGNAATITKAKAQTTNGIHYAESKYSTMITVDKPVCIPGAESIWSGQWQLKVTRVGSGKGGYALGALAREDMRFSVNMATNGKAAPGKKVWVHATLKDKAGKPITNARMTGTMISPSAWMGDKLIAASRRSIHRYKTVIKSQSKVMSDIVKDDDKYITSLMEKTALPPGHASRFVLRHRGKGEYVGSFIPGVPGEHQVAVTCKGVRVAQRAEITAHKKALEDVLVQTAPIATQHYAKAFTEASAVTARAKATAKKIIRSRGSRTVAIKTARASARISRQPVKLSAAALKRYETNYKRAALKSLITSLRKRQRYTLEYRGTWQVPFVPSPRHSEVFGYMEDRDRICLHVAPRDAGGRRLGPGYADRIYFTTPVGRTHRWPAKDMLDGTYEVEVPFKMGASKIDLERATLVGPSIAMKHPAYRPMIRPKRPELGLKHFGVTVMGVTMPITVFAMAGNKNTKRVHLLNCKQLGQLDDADLIWFEDIKDVIKHKYIPCPKCMLLPPRLRPVKPEKPTPVKPARRVKKAARKPVRKPVRKPAKPARRVVRKRVKR